MPTDRAQDTEAIRAMKADDYHKRTGLYAPCVCSHEREYHELKIHACHGGDYVRCNCKSYRGDASRV